MTRIYTILWVLISSSVILIFFNTPAALGDTNSNGIHYSGNLIDIPPCDINRGNLIEIDFGQVGVNKVSETGEDPLYQQQTLLEVNCVGTRPDLLVRYQGNATTFDNAAVKTSITDFGIQMRRGAPENTRIIIGEAWLIPHDAVGNDSSLSFIAVPVKRKGAVLGSGSFYATAGLQLEYP
ncbi:fimbrial protein [Serratia aquatilis]|uniref:Fimbrial protein n=1 Tax=Serratia aquatilis TaxID=1737515 RepID=A0ABV6EBW0_9GAMM